tara:strand:+ start:132 stop:467 length:336 start_codon:yes stop_codon:yes gene_type:complete
MKKIVILLIILSSLFGQYYNKWKIDPTLLRQLYVLDETYIKHYPNQIEWKLEHQVTFIRSMQEVMRGIENGEYQTRRAQKIVNVIKKYVDVEKQHQKDLKSLKKELRELTK